MEMIEIIKVLTKKRMKKKKNNNNKDIVFS